MVQSYSPGVANVHPIYINQKWLPWQRPLEPRNRLCLHRIAWPQKPTSRIKQRIASYGTTEVIAHRKPKTSCHSNVHICRVSAISAFCRPTTQTLLHNQLPSRYRETQSMPYRLRKSVWRYNLNFLQQKCGPKLLVFSDISLAMLWFRESLHREIERKRGSEINLNLIWFEI